MKRTTTRVAWASLLLGAVVAAGCGSSDDGGAVGGGAAGTDKAPPVYTVTARETGGGYAFDVPKDIKGGVITVKLVSDAANKEPHDFQLAKMEGHKLAEVLEQVGSDSAPLQKWLKNAAGVGTLAPGATSTATFDLDPNSEYAFFCTEAGDKGPHSQHGMSGEFTTGDDSGASLPDAAATITAKEYTFDFAGLKAGTNTIRFHNAGTMLHHVLLFPMNPGASFADVQKALASQGPPSGPPPVDFEKGVASAVAGPGESIVYTADLPAGDYVAVCFMPDPGTAGPPHVAKGMIKQVTIS